MQEMGLEPTRPCGHRHLKPARLPIPPLLRANYILTFFIFSVNLYFLIQKRKWKSFAEYNNWRANLW